MHILAKRCLLGSLSYGVSTFLWHLNAFAIRHNFISAHVQHIPIRDTI